MSDELSMQVTVGRLTLALAATKAIVHFQDTCLLLVVAQMISDESSFLL